MDKEINKVIMKYLGTHYKYQGKSIEEGLDCANLCTLVGKDLGILIPNINHMLYDKDSYSVLFNVKDNTTLWKEIQPKANTLAVFKVNGIVQHVGYMINEFEFIHIMENSKVTVDSLDSIQWQRRLVKCYEYIGDKQEI